MLLLFRAMRDDVHFSANGYLQLVDTPANTVPKIKSKSEDTKMHLYGQEEGIGDFE